MGNSKFGTWNLARSVTLGSWLLIDGHHFAKHTGEDVFVGFGEEIDFATKNCVKFILVAKVIASDIAEGTGVKVDLNIHIAGFGIEVGAEHGSKQAHSPDPAGSAKIRDFLVIDEDRQFQSAYGNSSFNRWRRLASLSAGGCPRRAHL